MRFSIFMLFTGLIACNPASFNNNIPLPLSYIQKQIDLVFENYPVQCLEGQWIRIDDDEGLQTYENWTSNSPTHESWKYNPQVQFHGYSYAKANNDIVWQEESTLFLYPDKADLLVKLSNGHSVKYKCTATSSDNYLVCVNKKNDYPKKIEYWINCDTLKTFISGGGPDVPFTFKRNISSK